MVGTITFDWHGTEITATLADDFTWTVQPADAELQSQMNQFYGPPEGGDSPGLGQPGSVQLFGTAEALGGKATLAEKPGGADAPETIY